MDDYQVKFQQLLRELFQFDNADLDFGIYRIMNHKREIIERFIIENLPQTIAEDLERGALAEQSRATQTLEAARRKVLDALGDNALDAEGNLIDQYRATKAGKEYLEAQTQAAGARDHQALEAAIYNHLYTFFSRYYQDGDFISKRRYSKKQRYAIPYNGEEVALYWANHDQYYIKTAEHFADYSYQAPNGVSVHFKLQAADVEQNNVKGDKRFFLPRLDGIAWDEESAALTIPFAYRPLTGQEAIAYGKRKQQEAIIAQALEKIPRQLADSPRALAALTAERRQTAQGEPVSYLEHHLRRYTARNTRDFFIHKDLAAFLSRELDFYLKNEVLNLEEIEAAGEDLAGGWFQLLRLIKRVGNHIIAFLTQIEEFQKMLWEKKKFVAETFYCVTVGHIPEEFYPEIAANEAQWAEWEALGMVSHRDTKAQREKALSAQRTAFLKAHPTLVLDTRHFEQDFTDRLLASFENLDEMIDGLLVHGENWQALNLLLEKYRERVKCVHIDPPYNTQTSGFLYKNDYQHSSWLTMIENRILLSYSLIVQPHGSFLCHIDENEHERLHLLLENMPISNGGTIVWDKRNPMTAGRGVATQHEYVIWRSNTDRSIFLRNKNIQMMLNKARELIEKRGGVTPEVQKAYADWVSKHPDLSGGEKAYRYIDEQGRIYQSVSLRAPEPRTDPKFHQPLIHPVTGKPCPVPPNGFSRTPETLREMIKQGEILFGPDETTQPRQKRFLTAESRRQISSVIQDARRGKADLDALGLENFPYCHAVAFYMELVGAAADDGGDVVLDYFAGSGTTGHAVINLNREDGGRRKFILVEMGDYFDTVLLPRIKKVTFSPEWKGGKPKRAATAEEAERSPRLVKVIRLESYEDALNNIAFDAQDDQMALQFDDYLLRYMLKWETRQSATLLDVEKLSRPFTYQLRLHRDGETHAQPVDLPETFNYLLGLHVETRRVYLTRRHQDTEEKNLSASASSGDQKYLLYRGTTRLGRTVVVIWRETEGWEQADYEHDRQFVAEHRLTEGADEVYVNGDSFIPGAQSMEGLFKARMFAEVEG